MTMIVYRGIRAINVLAERAQDATEFVERFSYPGISLEPRVVSGSTAALSAVALTTAVDGELALITVYVDDAGISGIHVHTDHMELVYERVA